MENWDLFEFKIETIDEIKVNMVKLHFNIISNVGLNYICFKYFKDERGAMEEVIHGCKKGFDGRIPDFNLAMHANCFN